jgi:hypothetical protein
MRLKAIEAVKTAPTLKPVDKHAILCMQHWRITNYHFVYTSGAHVGTWVLQPSEKFKGIRCQQRIIREELIAIATHAQ